jgi:enoyl-CoA hydratase/carnithine racemase
VREWILKMSPKTLPSDSDAVLQIKASLPQRDPNDVSTWLPVLFIDSFIDFDKPLFAAVNGPAIGEGFSSLLHCDVVYAADSAYFWAPFARAGVAPEFCSTYLMPKILGASRAHAALYLGEKITASQALGAGFVLEVLPAGDGFEEQVLDKIQKGLELSGPPELRAKTLSAYKAIVVSESERAHLRQVCRDEFELIRDRSASGDTSAVQDYYSKDLPG